MSHCPPPDHPLLRLEMEYDHLLLRQWMAYCDWLLPQGIDPNRPPSFVPRFPGYAGKKRQQTLDAEAEVLLAQWRSVRDGDLLVRVGERADVTTQVSDTWGAALRLLDVLLSVAEEAGLVQVIRLQHLRSQAAPLREVLVATFSRGVQVGEEILALLRAGFASGAMSRWRTLHEIAVVAEFIRLSGEGAARRYLDHDAVGRFDELDLEQKRRRATGEELIAEAEMRAIRERLAAVKEAYGEQFVGDYGWAHADLGLPPKERVTFAKLEARVGLKRLRPAYRSASESIHAGIRGHVANPSSLSGKTPRFNTRPTPFGHAEPAVLTTRSIEMLTCTLLGHQPFPLDEVRREAVRRLSEETVRSIRNHS